MDRLNWYIGAGEAAATDPFPADLPFEAADPIQEDWQLTHEEAQELQGSGGSTDNGLTHHSEIYG